MVRRRLSTSGPTAAVLTDLDRAPVALVGSDVAGRITSWNVAATKLLGWRQPDVVGRQLTEIFGRDVLLGAGLDRAHARAVTSFGPAIDVEVLADADSPVRPLLDLGAAREAAGSEGEGFRASMELALALDEWLRQYGTELAL